MLSSLTRVTSGGRLIPVVDGLRCVAIAAVVLYHLEDYLFHQLKHLDAEQAAVISGTWLRRLLHTGNCGVQLFFSISGFILALPFVEHRAGRREAVNLSRYYWRRVTRLEPPYLLNLFLITALLAIVKRVPLTELLPHWGASMVYLHGLIFGTMSTINGVAWSLEIEVQFYLLAPFIVPLILTPLPVVRRCALITVIAGLIVWKTWYGPISPRLMGALPYALDHFLVGILLADLYVTDWKCEPRTSHWWDLAACGVWPLIPVSQLYAGTYHCLPLLTFLAYLTAFKGSRLSKLLSIPVFVVTGGMCYTIYLYHFFIISFCGRFTWPVTSSLNYPVMLAVQTLLIVPPTWLICAVLFRLCERPWMAFGAKRRSVSHTL